MCRIGGEGDRFLVVQRIPDVPDVFVQVWHERVGDGTDGEYRLEHREGRDRFVGTVLTAPERVAEAMTGRARRTPGRETGIDRTPVDHDAPEEAGGFDGADETTTAVGQQVVAALAVEGLSAEWDGDPTEAITVAPLDRRKRLVDEAMTRPRRVGEASKQ